VPGEYEILCEELCGVGHFAMRGRVVVTPREEFDTWLAAMPTFDETQALAKADPLAGAAQYAVCMACHGPSGEGNPALNAPRLAGQEAWYLRRQMHAFRNGLRGAHERDTFGAQMRAFASMLPDDTAIRNLSAYIETLPGHSTPATVTGDAARGRSLYTTCSACHGTGGEGIWALNAPRLAEMSDWYLVRQLQNFQQRVRGAHGQDFYGWQMATMADSLKNERSINDVVAYINTLDPRTN
jgi:cytochrome c oxidase subunit II